ncbi:MAG: type II secretion system protein [Fimbriimonadales bacterium]
MRRANSLVGMLVVIAIIALLAIVLLKGDGIFSSSAGSPRKDNLGKTILGRSILKAKDDKCRIYLGEIRESLLINRDEVDNKWPATLQDTKLGADFYKCPLGAEPYKYNPETGEVKCVHPGHEKY